MTAIRSIQLSALCASAILSACSSPPHIKPEVATPGGPNAEIALRESLASVAGEMASLETLAPAVAVPRLPVVPGELERRISLTWQGPLDGAVRLVAGNIGYTVNIWAPPKSIALDVAVSTGPEQVTQVFQQLGEAAGRSATVELDPLHHQVWVVHHV